ncbi:hypothetical protein LH676_11830 [Acinetobacter baumannii]|nr:hypothetical protein [Acinetobacter baumannii]MCF1300218.1 hypothetical protein [Acinetobacter baumannii]
MDKCREEFEKLPGISTFLPGFKFNEATNEYERSEEFTLPEYTLGFFNGAWYAFQHQQAKVDELQNNINLLNEALDIKEQLNQKLREREDELQKQLSEYIFVSETLDEMYVKEAQKSDELQKRVDAALKETQFALQYVEEDMRGNHEFLQMAMIRTLKALEQALKGEG